MSSYNKQLREVAERFSRDMENSSELRDLVASYFTNPTREVFDLPINNFLRENTYGKIIPTMSPSPENNWVHEQYRVNKKIEILKKYFKDEIVGVGRVLRHLSEQGIPTLSLPLEELIARLEEEYDTIR